MKSLLETSTLKVVLLTQCDKQTIPPERRFDLMRTLLEKGHSVTCTPGEGDVAPHDRNELLVLSEAEDRTSGELEKDNTHVHIRDISGLEPESVVQLVEDLQEETKTYKPGEWKPWFPVIDYDRCTHCMQCLSFCLFDVYGVDEEKKIEVRNNEKCKTNCPACSRVCPEVAILFPKYNSGPINGAEVNEGDLDREKMKTDISALLGGDIYAMLRERHERAASRFSKERDESRALKERTKCLKKLGEQLDIPPEVMMALPSLEEIQMNAENSYRNIKDRNIKESKGGNLG